MSAGKRKKETDLKKSLRNNEKERRDEMIYELIYSSAFDQKRCDEQYERQFGEDIESAGTTVSRLPLHLNSGKSEIISSWLIAGRLNHCTYVSGIVQNTDLLEAVAAINRFKSESRVHVKFLR